MLGNSILFLQCAPSFIIYKAVKCALLWLKAAYMSNLTTEINKRRTFAIISHPDAGKTTITEKVLLFGQAIQKAGTVKGRGSNQHAKSDWMEMEKERGISVTTSVMKFP